MELISLNLSNIVRQPAELSVVARHSSSSALQKRAYAAALFNRLTEDWPTFTTSADLDIWRDLYRMRARARITSQNHPYAAKFLRMVEKNVAGPKGIGLQVKVPKQRGKGVNRQAQYAH
jgi:capsid protein